MIADHWRRWPTRSRLLVENEDQRAYIRKQNERLSTAEWAFQDALLALQELDPAVAERVRVRWSDVVTLREIGAQAVDEHGEALRRLADA